jgi:hypothetical protein
MHAATVDLGDACRLGNHGVEEADDLLIFRTDAVRAALYEEGARGARTRGWRPK